MSTNEEEHNFEFITRLLVRTEMGEPLSPTQRDQLVEALNRVKQPQPKELGPEYEGVSGIAAPIAQSRASEAAAAPRTLKLTMNVEGLGNAGDEVPLTRVMEWAESRGIAMGKEAKSREQQAEAEAKAKSFIRLEVDIPNLGKAGDCIRLDALWGWETAHGTTLSEATERYRTRGKTSRYTELIRKAERAGQIAPGSQPQYSVPYVERDQLRRERDEQRGRADAMFELKEAAERDRDEARANCAGLLQNIRALGALERSRKHSDKHLVQRDTAREPLAQAEETSRVLQGDLYGARKFTEALQDAKRQLEQELIEADTHADSVVQSLLKIRDVVDRLRPQVPAEVRAVVQEAISAHNKRLGERDEQRGRADAMFRERVAQLEAQLENLRLSDKEGADALDHELARASQLERELKDARLDATDLYGALLQALNWLSNFGHDRGEDAAKFAELNAFVTRHQQRSPYERSSGPDIVTHILGRIEFLEQHLPHRAPLPKKWNVDLPADWEWGIIARSEGGAVRTLYACDNEGHKVEVWRDIDGLWLETAHASIEAVAAVLSRLRVELEQTDAISRETCAAVLSRQKDL